MERARRLTDAMDAMVKYLSLGMEHDEAYRASKLTIAAVLRHIARRSFAYSSINFSIIIQKRNLFLFHSQRARRARER